ncbi:hypothetical protein Ocin01_08150 [Orchesella cincta]|uniref:Uncharacterized protein n=1 Tax=Orchesella cincta TaxID=48709 RepID=A0A1D2MZV9_ORCCI|nr:hypothetical protein Ocin01_08150 [Orchesella cincta]
MSKPTLRNTRPRPSPPPLHKPIIIKATPIPIQSPPQNHPHRPSPQPPLPVPSFSRFFLDADGKPSKENLGEKTTTNRKSRRVSTKSSSSSIYSDHETDTHARRRTQKKKGNSCCDCIEPEPPQLHQKLHRYHYTGQAMGDRDENCCGKCLGCFKNLFGCVAKTFGTTFLVAIIIIIAIILVVLLIIGGIVYALWHYGVITFEDGKPGLNQNLIPTMPTYPPDLMNGTGIGNGTGTGNRTRSIILF